MSEFVINRGFIFVQFKKFFVAVDGFVLHIREKRLHDSSKLCTDVAVQGVCVKNFFITVNRDFVFFIFKSDVAHAVIKDFIVLGFRYRFFVEVFGSGKHAEFFEKFSDCIKFKNGDIVRKIFIEHFKSGLVPGKHHAACEKIVQKSGIISGITVFCVNFLQNGLSENKARTGGFQLAHFDCGLKFFFSGLVILRKLHEKSGVHMGIHIGGRKRAGGFTLFNCGIKAYLPLFPH